MSVPPVSSVPASVWVADAGHWAVTARLVVVSPEVCWILWAKSCSNVVGPPLDTIVVVLRRSPVSGVSKPGSSVEESGKRGGRVRCESLRAMTSNQARLPAEFKHITKRRKRN